jgi:hypothetical protein
LDGMALFCTGGEPATNRAAGFESLHEQSLFSHCGGSRKGSPDDARGTALAISSEAELTPTARER